MHFTLSFISGMMLGIEFVSGKDLEMDEEFSYIVLDLLIVRVLITSNWR